MPIKSDIGKHGEAYIGQICSRTAIADFVFMNPKYMRGTKEKELCDALIIFENTIIFVEIKTADPFIHASFDQSRRFQWKTKKVNEASKQIAGARSAVSKGLITHVSNDRRHNVALPHMENVRTFGLIIVDYKKETYDELHLLPLPNVDGLEMLVFNFGDMVAATHELSTIGDLIDYLVVRSQLKSVLFESSDELDLLAFYKTHRHLFDLREDGASLPDSLLVQEGIWDAYSKLEARKVRDELDRPSWIFDRVIDRLFDSISSTNGGEIDIERLKEPGDERNSNHIQVLTELNRYRRVERRVFGEKFLEKSRGCNSHRPTRYFAMIPSSGFTLFILVSMKERSERVRDLKYFTLAAKVAYKLNKIIGLATEPLECKYRSVDAIWLDYDTSLDEEFSQAAVAEFQRSFAASKSRHIDEFPANLIEARVNQTNANRRTSRQSKHKRKLRKMERKRKGK